jgi:hypothetical protein
MTSQCRDLGARSQRAGASLVPGSPSPVPPTVVTVAWEVVDERHVDVAMNVSVWAAEASSRRHACVAYSASTTTWSLAWHCTAARWEAGLFTEVVAVGGHGQEEWDGGEEDQRDHSCESHATPCRRSAAGHGESVPRKMGARASSSQQLPDTHRILLQATIAFEFGWHSGFYAKGWGAVAIKKGQNELHTDTAQTVLLFSLLTCDPGCVRITICCLILRAKWNFSSFTQMQKVLLTK